MCPETKSGNAGLLLHRVLPVTSTVSETLLHALSASSSSGVTKHGWETVKV